jgi:hypothetical protein
MISILNREIKVNKNRLRQYCWYKILHYDIIYLIQYYSTSNNKIRCFGYCYAIGNDGLSIYQEWSVMDGSVYSIWGEIYDDDIIIKVNQNEFHSIMEKNNINREYK